MHPDKLEFKQLYLLLLRTLRQDLKAHAAFKTLDEYAEEENLALGDPPHWSDLVPDAIKAKFYKRQGIVHKNITHYKQVFDRTPRPKKGFRKVAALLKQLDDEYGNTMRGLQEANVLDAALGFGEHRLSQIEAAQQYLQNWPPNKPLPTSWINLLPEEDRCLPRDDAPRTIVLYKPPAYAEQARSNDGEDYAPRGRPKGSKDSAPRTRRTNTSAEKKRAQTARANFKNYKRIVAEKEAVLRTQEKS